MITSVNKKMNRFSKRIGIDIEIPLPSRRSVELSSKINTAVALTCIGVSIVTSSKVMLGLGVLSGISASIANSESKKLK